MVQSTWSDTRTSWKLIIIKEIDILEIFYINKYKNQINENSARE